MKQLLLSISLLFCLLRASTQPYYFRHYQVENGLSNNTVTCSIQDKAGFLWFGTKDGLNRFDGYHFKPFHTSPNERTLNPDFVLNLFLDAQGILWVGLEKGLYRFDAMSEQLLPVFDSLPQVASLYTDGKKELWFTSERELYQYSFETTSLRHFPSADYFLVTSICASEDGSVWFATTDGHVKAWQAATQTFASYDLFAHSPPAASNFIQKIYAPGNGTLLVGTSSQGLKLFQIPIHDYRDVLTYNADKTTVFVRDFLPYSPTEMWLATESGIFIWNLQQNTFTNLKKKALDPYSLSDNAVYSICKDQEGGVWAGTYFGGINYYPKQYGLFKKFFPDYSSNSISGNVVREICADADGNLWIGTEDAGLNKLHAASGTITRFQPTGRPGSISYSNIHGLLVAGNELWIGTFEHGLDVLDRKTGMVKKHYKAGPGPYDLKNNFIVSLLQTRSGSIYLGTGEGVYKYEKAMDGFTRIAALPQYIFVSSLLEDHHNRIWVGTHNEGAFCFDPATATVTNYKNNAADKHSLSNNKINALCEDSQHNIWLATEGGGVCKLPDGSKQFTYYTTRDGLPSNFVFKILEDNNQQLWASTSKGLAQVNPATQTVAIYTKENGLLNDQFNYNSGFKAANGTLYFGSVKGMVTFCPDGFAQRHFAAPVYITGFQVHGYELEINQDSGLLKKSVVYTNAIQLPYNKSSFSIDFAALSFTAPEMTRYNYIMEGLDHDWTALQTNRKVYFTSLAPGHYSFRVKAFGDGLSGPRETQLQITIRPPFWATPWAYLLYAVICIGIIYYLVRSYHQHTQDLKEKEIYEAKIDFFTNVAHEIRTPLTLIKGPVENLREQVPALPAIHDDVSDMERATNRLISLVTQILDFRKTEINGFSLNFSNVNITELVLEEFQGFAALARKRGLACTTELPPVPLHLMADEEALRKIFSNLFSNAVKYAATQVQINMHMLKSDDTQLIVEIRSDGELIPSELREKLFEPFYRMKQSAKQKGTGIGLALARSLATLHNGRLYLGEPQGGCNKFVLCLPLKPLPAHNGKGHKVSVPARTIY